MACIIPKTVRVLKVGLEDLVHTLLGCTPFFSVPSQMAQIAKGGLCSMLTQHQTDAADLSPANL